MEQRHASAETPPRAPAPQALPAASAPLSPSRPPHADAQANLALGDIVKVTPSSKVCGERAPPVTRLRMVPLAPGE